MRYAKVIDNIVVGIIYPAQDGFIEVEDSVCPGVIQSEDGSFSAPPPLLTDLMWNLRHKRDQLLRGSDWTGLADSALTSEVSAKWKLYRQKLRNLPSGLNTPAKVKAAKWPAKPV